MIKRMMESMADLRGTYKKLLLFEACYMLLTSYLFVPAIAYIFHRMLRALDAPVLPVDRLRIAANGIGARWERKLAAYWQTRTKRHVLFLILVVYSTGTLALNAAWNQNLIYVKWDIDVIGHRGDLLHAPENSLSGIRSAIDKQVNAVEIDVQMTKDGVVVLHHDYTLQRMAGIPSRVHELSYADLASLDIGGGFLGMYPGERIPTLEEALFAAKDTVKLVIEIKPYGEKEELARKVVELVQAYEMVEEVYIQSFDNAVLRAVRSADSAVRIGQILYLAAGNVASLDIDFYTVQMNMLSRRFVERAHRNGREVWVWTVNTERNAKEALKYDVDGIITDYPEMVHRVAGIR